MKTRIKSMKDTYLNKGSKAELITQNNFASTSSLQNIGMYTNVNKL